MKPGKFIRGGLFAAVLVLAGLILFLAYSGLDLSVFYFAKFTGSLARIGKIKGALSPKIFHILLLLLSVVDILILLVAWQFDTLYDKCAAFFKLMLQSIHVRYINDWRGSLLFVVAVSLGVSVYYMVTMPVSYDEAWTYANFSSNSVLYSICYYPAPNNHVLHSILTNFFVLLPIPALIAIRIPTILVSILCLLFLFSLIREYYNRTVALIAVAVFSGLVLTVYYSYMSRGYALECLSFILTTYAVLKIIHDPHKKVYWAYFSIASVMGFYTMPSFLYPFIIANLFLLISLAGIRIHHVVSVIAVGVTTVVLYMPIIAVNGINALINNRYTAPRSRTEVIHTVMPFFYKAYFTISGLSSWIVILVCIAGALVSIVWYKNRVSYFFALILLLSPVLLILHSVIPFARTFEYYTCIYAFYFAVLFYEITRRVTLQKMLIPLLILIQLGLIYNSYGLIQQSEQYAIEVHKTLPLINQGKRFLISSRLFDAYLIFDLKSRKIKDYTIRFMSAENGKLDSDTISGSKFDFYIIDRGVDATKDKHQAYQNEYYSIYN